MPPIYSWQLLRAGRLRLDGGSMFGVVPKPMWAKLAPPDEQNRIGLQTNCLLLEGSGNRGQRSEVKGQKSAYETTSSELSTQNPELILIETGFGDKWSDKERGFYDLEHRTVVDALREVGVEPAQIAHVIVTHLHFDHAAGLTRIDEKGRIVPTFPNAEVIVQKEEWIDALENKSTMNRTYLRTHLDPIKDRVRLTEGDREVLPGITVWPMVGHTWGMQAVRFEDRVGTVVFAGDILPTVNHVGLPFSLAYDMLPYHNMLSKMRLYQNAIAGDWRLVLDHEPGHAVYRVKKDGDKYALVEA